MKVIGYCRLSKDDGNAESSSISNQKKIIQEFANNNGFKIDKFLCDDGYSGYSFSRPAFDELNNLLNNNKVDIIIVKDLSRIGRHNAKVQLFLENIQEAGKRVISISESYDTLNEDSQMTTGIYTWANENFVKTTSQKIRKSITSLQKEGKFICSVPYGYKKDDNDKYKIVVDPLTSPYVKQIYDMYISGMGLRKIARELTDNNIPTPYMHKGMKSSGHWDIAVISKIIRNEFYIGTLVLNKTKARAINGKRLVVPKEDRYVFENNHEPIIDKQTFYLVQELIEKRSKGNYRGQKTPHGQRLFTGLLFCADCGKQLTSGGGRSSNLRYICKTYNIYGTSKCSNHAILEEDIKYVLLDYLNHCKDNLHSIVEDLDKIIQEELQVKSDTTDDIRMLSLKITENKKILEMLIDQKLKEMLDKPDMADIIDKTYSEMIDSKYKIIQSLEKQLDDQKNIDINELEMKKGLKSAIDIMEDIINSNDITKKQVLLLVDKIIVYEDTGIDIYLKGDLHDLCNNYFKVSDSKTTKIKKLMYHYIIDNKDKFVLNGLYYYIKSNGLTVSYKTLSDIVNKELVSKDIVKLRPRNHGYMLVGSDTELSSVLLNNINVGTNRRLCNNSDKYKLAIKITEWIKSLEYNNAKHLF